MRFRITVRGDGTEVRGYATMEALASLTSPPGEQPYMVIASPADDDFDPFKEEQLRELHHFETEQENERLKADHTESEKALIDQVNTQADTIERLADELAQAQNNHADLVRKYRERGTRITEARNTIKRIAEARKAHPECDVHPDDDPIQCGWKQAVVDIDKALEDWNGN